MMDNNYRGGYSKGVSFDEFFVRTFVNVAQPLVEKWTDPHFRRQHYRRGGAFTNPKMLKNMALNNSWPNKIEELVRLIKK
jgi:hypothetical protein